LVFSARTDVDARIDQYAQLRTGGDAAKMEAMAGLVGMMKNFATMLPDDTTRAAWAARQAYIALGFAMAAAAELEVDSCPMEGFMPAGVKEVLGLPDHVHPVVLLPIGTRASDDTPYPKARFPQDDLFTNR
jgi:nitroreductase